MKIEIMKDMDINNTHGDILFLFNDITIEKIAIKNPFNFNNVAHI